MKKALSFLRMDKKLLFQFGIVFVAFLIMVLISSIYSADIVGKNVASYGREVVSNSSVTIEAYLSDYKTILSDVSYPLLRLKEGNAAVDVMLEEMVSWTNWLLYTDKDHGEFCCVYGVIDGSYLDGLNRPPAEGLEPEQRPWYVGAVHKKGEIFYTNPYIDAHTGKYIITLSKLLSDSENSEFGVVAIDVYISEIFDFADSLRLMDEGYGILLDSDRVIAVHPDQALIGKRIGDIRSGAGGYTELSKAIASGKDVSAFPINSDGVSSVAFFSKLSNGWYIGIISPKSVFYGEVYSMTAVLSVVGFFIMAALCVALAFLHREKLRSDEASKVKSSFLANMSHEIRTPMNAIIGMTELLLSEQLSPRQADYVNDINISSHALLGIINDILDLSKIEAGKLELIPVDYDFHLFDDNIRSMFKFMAERKGLEFIYETKGTLPTCLYGDDIRLRQVLTNICGNAVKFTASGFVKLRVISDDKTMTFEISDSGSGIRAEDIPNLFDAFIQADRMKNRNIVGTGLGLPISKKFIEMMNGWIHVTSEYGHGTVFSVTVPKIIGDEYVLKSKLAADHVKPFTAPSASVLVVDDNELNLKVASGLLKLYQIDVVTALSGKEAIETIREIDFDIVFMDHMMPEMDGIETTAEIRRLGGKYKQLTIIALTANAIRGAKEMFISKGLNGFISKPIDSNELTMILRDWLPREKIKERTDAETPVIQGGVHNDSGFIGSVRKIGAINTDIAMIRVSGLESMFYDALKIIYGKLPSECDKMEAFQEKEDLHNLAILVHSMKSSLATIGAMELSEVANKLETAAKKGQSLFCAENLPGFLAELRDLRKQLSAVFVTDVDAAPRPEGNTDFLSGNLQGLAKAIEDFDGDLCTEIINKLLGFDFGNRNNELLEKVKSALDDFDFDAAAQAIERYNSKS